MSENNITIVNDPELNQLAVMIRKSLEPRIKVIAEELAKAKWFDVLPSKIKEVA
jgi:hypothetical protein